MQKWSAAQHSDDYLSHFFTVGLWIQGGLGQQDGVFLRRNPEFVVERMMPNLKMKIALEKWSENHFFCPQNHTESFSNTVQAIYFFFFTQAC